MNNVNIKKLIIKNIYNISILVYITLLGIFNIQSLEGFKPNETVYISLTTVPERLQHEWFYENIQNLLNLNGNYKVMLNIPKKYKNSIEEYKIPDKLLNIEKSNKKLSIFRPDIDYGPLTKLYGSLINQQIPDHSPLLVCDDDIRYLKNFVTNIYDKYVNDSSIIYTYCGRLIEGYKGFMVKKEILKPLIHFNRPDSCFRIDDDYIGEVVKKLKLTIKAVPYNGDTKWDCSMNKEVTDTHPKWNELGRDHRPPIQKECIKQFHLLNL